jgi:hypothetical protein
MPISEQSQASVAEMLLTWQEWMKTDPGKDLSEHQRMELAFRAGWAYGSFWAFIEAGRMIERAYKR